MQGLILAAGMGKRLGRYTQDQTKCMVRINGKTLIEYALDALVKSGISRIVIVIGYKAEKLRSFIGHSYKGIPVIYVVNDVYDRTNNIYSLWLARMYLCEEDTILLESDIIFDEEIIFNLIKDPKPNMVVVAKYESWMDGTVTLLDEKGKIESFISKKYFLWHNISNYYKTVNIYKFSKAFSRDCYMPFLEAYIKAMGNNEYYEQVLRVITYLENIDLVAYKLSDERWYEIDDVQDLDIAEVLFAKEMESLTLYQKRYGGYWRFPKLKDFCYLVNPYFPNKFMIEEMQSNFMNLITEYPSCQNIQNLLAAKMFNCETSEIFVGNGAAELIKILMNNIHGFVGIIYPTFNEYPENIESGRVKRFILKNKDFSYTISDLKDFSRELDVLVLINPDNPTGHFFNEEEIIELVEYLDSRGIDLILDESFIDFAGENISYSMIDTKYLKRYKNLIVIKSISKSYGVPGIRLGVLATGNHGLMSRIKKEIPVWNINSLGEFFLQIIGKYSFQYREACSSIWVERERFYKKLSKISYLKILPSYANYFLCEVISDLDASRLTQILLNKYSILIKDCTGKLGFENSNYVRIAVKGEKENEYLLERLLEIEKNIETYISDAAAAAAL